MISLEISISPRRTRVDVSDVAPIETECRNAERSVEAVSALNSSASDDRDNTRADEYIPEIRIDIARGRRRRLRAAPDGLVERGLHACPL